MSATLSFLGATGTVTGSKFLVSTGDGSVLVDCGLYQGMRELRDRNWAPLPVAAEAIDDVVLSHAHLDHTGYLPALVSAGYAGPIRATSGTCELVPLLLRDSAHIMQEDAEHANARGYSRHHPALPLYTDREVDEAVGRLRSAPYDVPTSVHCGQATWRVAGHILGSATVELRLDSGESVGFSGDLGRQGHPILVAPADPPDVETLVVESTYGDRFHPQRSHMLDVVAGTIRTTVGRRGSVLIPAFAVDRTEVVLLALDELRRAGAIPDVPIYLDSPMALAALAVYRKAVAEATPDIRRDVADEVEQALEGRHLVEMTTVEQSKRLNRPDEPSIIVSASGMATGGRVVHHLEGMLPDPRNSVLLVGHQAEGTRGRALQEGAGALKMHGRYVPVRAEVVTVEGLSVHADQDDIIGWLGRAARPPRTVYVVHGEPAASAALAERIRRDLGWCAVVPRYREQVLLD